MELNLLSESGVRALLNAGMIEFVDDIPCINENILSRLDVGDTVQEAIRFVTTPKFATYECPCCHKQEKQLATATLVMHRCPARNGELRNLKLVKES